MRRLFLGMALVPVAYLTGVGVGHLISHVHHRSVIYPH